MEEVSRRSFLKGSALAAAGAAGAAALAGCANNDAALSETGSTCLLYTSDAADE